MRAVCTRSFRDEVASILPGERSLRPLESSGLAQDRAIMSDGPSTEVQVSDAGLSRRGRRVRLRLAYWVAQVCNADARDHRRVAEGGWCAGEVVEESNAGAKKNRRD